MKRDETDLPPSEVYLSTDETCRDFLSRESALSLNVVPGKFTFFILKSKNTAIMSSIFNVKHHIIDQNKRILTYRNGLKANGRS